MGYVKKAFGIPQTGIGSPRTGVGGMKNAFILGKSVPVFKKSVYVFGKSVPVFGKSVYVFWKSVYVFRKSVYAFGKSVHVFEKSVSVFGKSVPAFWKSVPAFWKPVPSKSWRRTIFALFINKLYNMKSIFLLCLSITSLWPLAAQPGYRKLDNGILVTLPGNDIHKAKTIRLLVVNEQIIQVTATPEHQLPEKHSLIRVAPFETKAQWSVSHTPDSVFLTTGQLKAALSLTTGEVAFCDSSGALIVQESRQGKHFLPVTVDGEKGYTTRQQFDSPEDEAFYGLGQHQSDEFNYKGKNEELFQYNTKVSVPFVVSSRNYGILFDNYSLSRFGDERPYANLDIFRLYDKDGNEGGLTARYYKEGGKVLFAERKESRIDYETHFTHRDPPETFDFKGETFDKFPAGFRFPNSFVTWEGEIEPGESGIYRFKLYYGAYTKVYLDNKPVVEERWRPSWNPNSVKFSAELTAGKKVPLRIEWREGAGSYIGLKVLSPRPPEETGKLSLWSEMGQDLDYYLIHGNSPDQVIAGYRYVTGKSPIMPSWAMGFWQSRERYRTQDELLAALKELRARNFGVDNIVLDWHYWKDDDWGSHEFDSSRFANPKAMVDSVHALHARMMISVWPKFYASTRHFKEFDDRGWMYRRAIKDSILDFVGKGYLASFYDAYAPGARKLFWKQIDEHLYSLGIDAWWMDASEPNIKDCTPHSYQKALTGPTALGSSTQYYNTYALVNAQAIFEGQKSKNPNDRVFLLTRSGFAGQQRYSTATWSGDIGTRWEELKAQISAGLNFALSGIPYWTMDIGGFCVERRYSLAQRLYDTSGEENEDLKEWRELLARWYQFGTFTPLYRAHGQFPLREIYNIAPENHPAYRTIYYYNKLRYRLMPYIYSLAGKTYWDDYTIMRPLVMDYPGDVHVRDIATQYMFGPSLMVVPVHTYRATAASVYFPAGCNWYDFYNGRKYAGGETKEVDAPYGRMPLFVPEGGIILFGPEISYVGEKEATVIDVWVYAGKDGSFCLYEDEGTNYNYEKGAFSKIMFEYNDADKTLSVKERTGHYPGMPEKRTFRITHIQPGAPAGWDMKKTPDAVVPYFGKEVMVRL
jgi:alpha-D-xyloside xylohydrolase